MAAVVVDAGALEAGERLLEAVRAAGPGALVVAESPGALSPRLAGARAILRRISEAGGRTVFVTG